MDVDIVFERVNTGIDAVAVKPDDGQPKHNATDSASPVSNCQRRITRVGNPLNLV